MFSRSALKRLFVVSGALGAAAASFAVLAPLANHIAPAYAEDAKPAETASTPASADAVWAASFKDLTGAPQSLSVYKGKTALVYFWATWCESCQKEGPHFQALYEKFKDKNFVVVGIAVDNADKVREFVKAHGMAFPMVYGGSDAIKLSKDIGNSLGAVPFMVLIDRDGKIVEKITGDAPDGKLEKLLAPLLG